MTFLINWAIYSAIIYVTCEILPGIRIANFRSAVFMAATLAIVNTLVKPLLVLLTLPITVLTLGLFLLVINAGMLILASSFVAGITVTSFWWALVAALIISVAYNIFS